MSGKGVRGLLKYISNIFESDKDQEIQIGLPTDVKHVAHIGWDGPSVNSPSWMNEFQSSSPTTFASTPIIGDVQNKGQDSALKRVSEESKRRNNRDLHDLPPKASKRQSTGLVTETQIREKSSKPRQPKKSSNKPKGGSSPTQIPDSPDSQSDIPKKSHRHRSKENTSAGSSKVRSKAQPVSDSGSPKYKSRNKPKSSFEENGQDLLM